MMKEEIRHADNEKIDLKVWKRLIAYGLRYKPRVIFTILVLLVVSGADLAYPLFTRYAINHFITGGTMEGLPLFGVVYMAVVVVQAAGVILFVRNAGRLEMDISYDIRQEAFTHLQQLSFSYYDTTSVGWLMARLGSDVSRLSEMIAWSIVDVMWAVTFAIGVVIVLLVMNWKLGLLVLAITPVLAVLCLYFQRRILRQQRIVRKANSRITGAFNEGVMGAVTNKTLAREEAAQVEFEAVTGELKAAAVKAATLSAIFMPLVVNLGAIATALALWRGGVEVFAGVMDLGTLAAFITYTTQLFDPIQSLARILAEMQAAQASAERVIDLLDTQSDVKDAPEIVQRYGDLFHGKKENWPDIKGRVEFKDVTFRYKTGEEVLRNFSLTVEPGQNVALVGETGAGKTTIVNLVCRFYEPTEGEVRIDGVDYRQRSQLWLQSSLGYVLQSPHLFSGTVADNLRFAKPDATDEEIRRAAQMVHAEEFILSLPKGYDTQVGEGGGKLSTGQKQLLSLARVLLADPRIFVLDEATSSIDTETEALIQDAIQTVLAGRTSFVVAHRLSTIRSAGRILVIHNGQIQESGTHEELMALKGEYYSLYTHQYRREATQAALD
ncbi:MAG: ABC transporter ATP-binding protein/permease [Oscillospiraceae bacterium]|nr:ABC transporter ATP-binding protein/permease [Oscillospiraceae bacterium]